MLAELRINDIGVIAEAVLELGPGLTVLTGETGAGKTMVLSGLSLLFGGRADFSRIRAGQQTASVEGCLYLGLDSTAQELVHAAGGEVEDGAGAAGGEVKEGAGGAGSADGAGSAGGMAADAAVDGDPAKAEPGQRSLILRRTISAGGRSRAAAGGASVPASLLARIGADQLVIHGQSDQQRLVRPGEQRAALDRYAGLSTAACRAAFDTWRAAVAELAARRSSARELSREADLLRHGLGEIAKVAPQAGEDVELAALAERLGNAEQLRSAARLAHDLMLGEADPSTETSDVGSLLGTARQALQQVAGTDRVLDELAGRLQDLQAEAGELGSDFAGYERELEADPARLAVVEDRRARIGGLLRRYGADVTAVLQWSADAERRLADTDTSAEAMAELERRTEAAERIYCAAAGDLSTKRHAAAAALGTRVSAELAGLAMATAELTVQVSPRAVVAGTPTVQLAGNLVGAGAGGVDAVEWLFRSHPEAPALPLGRAASGGELSRLMLAVEVVLADTDPVPTMIFDEVDAGVGGRAAIEVGRRLAILARRHQVIVVTHLAQVAAFADRHLVIGSAEAVPGGEAVRGGEAVPRGEPRALRSSDIRSVSGRQRTAELARMLGGHDSATARDHAAELLETARRAIKEQ